MMDKHKANRILKIITEYEEVRLHLGLSHEEFRDKFYREVLMSDTPIAAAPVEDISKVAYCAQDNNSSLCTVKTCDHYDEKRTNHCKVVSCKILGRTPTTGGKQFLLDRFMSKEESKAILNAYFTNQPQEDTTMKELDPKVKEKQDKAKEDIEQRFTYHSPKEGQPEKYTALRNMCKDLALSIITMVPDSRERSLALTCLEECSMWANSGIARRE